MRGALIVISLIALLIVGILVTRNVDTHRNDEGNIEEIDQAKQAVHQADKAVEKAREVAKQAMPVH